QRVLYATDRYGHALVRMFSLTGTLLRDLTSHPTNAVYDWTPLPTAAFDLGAADGIFCPVTVDGGGTTFVQRYSDLDGQYLSRWPLHEDPDMPGPTGRYAACDQGHNVYVVVYGGGAYALHEYTSDGTFIQRWK